MKNNNGVMEARQEQLSRFPHRLSGTDQNSRAADLILQAFESLGLKTEVERFKVPGQLAFGIALNVLVPLLVFYFLKKPYWLAMIVFGVSVASLWGELTFSFHLFRRVIPAHASRNVEGVIGGEARAKKTVVIVAHHDTAKTGWLYRASLADRLAPVLRKIPSPFNKIYFPPFLGTLGLGAALLLRPWQSAGQICGVLSAAFAGVLGIVLLVTIQWGLSKPSPGANDNGSGILVLLELAERFSKRPPADISVRFLATGAEETGFFGVKNYLRRHKEFDKRDTLFINLDSVGGGELHWAVGEATLENIAYPAQGLDILSEAERRSGGPVLPRIKINAPTDAGPVARQGYRVLTLIGLENESIPPNFHKASDTFDRLEPNVLKRAAEAVENFVRHS
jgi:hypothetical protein